MNPAVDVENLSKMYRVDVSDVRAGRLAWRRAVRDALRAPLHRLRHGAGHGLHTEEFWALRDISFAVQRGEVLGIIGRNGAGKSTLLKILSQITVPTTGRAVIEGRVGSLLEVGTGFHPDLSGRENVYLNGAILGMTHREIRARFDEIVDFAGVAKFINTPVKRYSSGMRVRLGFGVAAFLQPEILIIDEVLAVGDVEFQRRCLGKMSEVAQDGRTVLFVSHNMGAVQQLTERCLLIENGRIESDGPTDQVVDKYLRMQSVASYGLITSEMHKHAHGVRFQRVQILDRDGRPFPSPTNFVPIHLVVDLEVEKPQPEMMLTFGINTVDGVSIVRIASEPGFFGDGPIQPGRYRVGLQFELPLNPGSYSIHLRADKNLRPGTQLSVVANALTFDLVESRKLGLAATRKVALRALLPLDGTWQLVDRAMLS